MNLMFQITNNNTKPYSDLCCSANSLYCKKHNYDFLELEAIHHKGYHYTWCKIFSSIELIQNTNYDYYFFLDADAIIINQEVTLESIIDKMKYDISFSKNGLNGGLLIATGGFIFNKNAKTLFDKCIELSNSILSEYKLKYWFEMAVINYLYDIGYKMDIFDMNTMNSYGLINIHDSRLKDLFLYHFQGRGDDEKAMIANEVYNIFYKETI